MSASDILLSIIAPRYSSYKELKKLNRELEEHEQQLVDSGFYDIVHEYFQMNLNITIVKGINLMIADRNGLSDPFVKIHGMTTERLKVYKTKVISKTLNPEWNQQIMSFENKRQPAKFVIYKGDSLTFIVWDKDRFGKDKLGEATMTFDDFVYGALDTGDSATVELELDIQGVLVIELYCVNCITEQKTNSDLIMESSQRKDLDLFEDLGFF